MTDFSMDTMDTVAHDIIGAIRKAGFDPALRQVQQVLCLVEEAGEFAAAYRRWAGMARRIGTFDDVIAELADVLIVTWCTADVLGIDLRTAVANKLKVIYARGWKETP